MTAPRRPIEVAAKTADEIERYIVLEVEERQGAAMYTLIRSIPLHQLLTTQAPALLASFVIAEMFYKFHSFTLECLAFLVTWFAIDAVMTIVRNAWTERRHTSPTP